MPGYMEWAVKTRRILHRIWADRIMTAQATADTRVTRMRRLPLLHSKMTVVIRVMIAALRVLLRTTMAMISRLVDTTTVTMRMAAAACSRLSIRHRPRKVIIAVGSAAVMAADLRAMSPTTAVE